MKPETVGLCILMCLLTDQLSNLYLKSLVLFPFFIYSVCSLFHTVFQT